jgi:hypothetical protein
MSGPAFHAWCGEAAKVDAFTATLSALANPEYRHDVEVSTPGNSGWVKREGVSIAEVIEVVRAKFTTRSRTLVSASGRTVSGEPFSLFMECCGVDYRAQWRPHIMLGAELPDWPEVDDPFQPDVVLHGGKRSRMGEAALFTMGALDVLEHVLLRICAPDESKRVTTGGMSGWRWEAPLELTGTYNLDGNVARDVALSWISIYEGDRIEHVAGLTMDALAARVDAASTGTRIGVAADVKRRGEHTRIDLEATSTKLGWPPHPGAVRQGARKMLPTDVVLTREEVLAILQTPPSVLLDALEAAAVPDPDWRDAEATALEMIEAKKRGEPTAQIIYPDGTHAHFLEHHAPFHVRRLPNGGVLLATHPYRTLWPLWADALDLLGIRRKGAA